MTWSFCPCRSQAYSKRSGEREDLPHLWLFKMAPFWRGQNSLTRPSPPQAGLKFHHMGQRPDSLQGVLGPHACPRASDPTGPSSLPLPGGLAAATLFSHEPW